MINNEEIITNIAGIIDYLDKLVYYLKEYDNKTREQDIAIQKLEEAVFWLTYGTDEANDE